MSRRKSRVLAQKKPNAGNAAPEVPASPRPGGWKVWRWRLTALVGTPILFFGFLELGLRVMGFGYPTSFLLKSSNHGEKTFVQNNQFGRRFFGERMTRLGTPISILRQKPAGTVRIFVFGESAAYGDPDPLFGLPRLLEAILSLRYPGTKFEVINAAVTGINSHVILPIARDCARADGDIWVIYMGNNEVVGPFGAGTVFGAHAPPLPLIRASLALKSTRVGQWLDQVRRLAYQTPADEAEWGGMRMFLNQKVSADDPQLETVYHNFERNLADIIHTGRRSGARIVLSTVAVNLKDCAPFASLHRAGLSDVQQADWQRLLDSGIQAQQSGNWRHAAELFQAAARIDDRHAELRFRQGRCALALGDAEAARRHFSAARDLDALRFRCDTRLNEVIRKAAADGNEPGVRLVDAEKTLAVASPGGVTGKEFFYEHVHLTFEGNYQLARAIAEGLEPLLPAAISSASRPWPGLDDCARALGHAGRDEQLALSEILGRLTDPPFTFQANQAEQRGRWVEQARQLPPADSPGSLRESRKACEAALARRPDDALLWEHLGEVQQAQKDYAGAEAAARRSLEAIPSNPQCWMLLGIALAQQEKYDKATDAFQQVFKMDPQAVWARHNLALCLQKMGRREEAVAEFKRAVAIKPRFGTTWLALGELYEDLGRQSEADECFRKALANRVNRADDLATLARFCLSHHWFEAAATNFADAVALNPSDPALLLEAGRSLAALHRHAEAAQCYAQAIEADPGNALAHLQLGITLGRLGKPAEAEPEFRQALRLKPDWDEARLNLGIALYQQRKIAEAHENFDAVLQLCPTNALALKYLQALQRQPTVPPGN